MFPVPLGFASNFETKSFVVAESELLFEFLSNRGFETASFAPLNRVLIAPYVGAEFASIFLVAPIRRWGPMFALLFQCEERPLRFRVLSCDLLNSRATDNAVVASSVLVLGEIPYRVTVEVVLTPFVG